MTTTEQLETVAVDDLIVDVNVRTDIHLDKSFVSSIRNHGIIQPPIGYRADDGKIHITAGQRRTLAAREIGLTEISVVIKPQEIAEAARIVTQLTENDQRQQLTDSERLHGYKQLAMFGVSVDQIARKTNKPKAHVETAILVSQSDVATDALAAYEINLDQAALITEFEGNAADVEQLLTVAANDPRQLDHIAQRIRDEHAYQAKRDELAAEAIAAGWTELDKTPSYDDKNIKATYNLWRADDDDKIKLEPETSTGYEGRRFFVGRAYEGPKVIHYIEGWREQGLATWDMSAGKGPLTDDEKAERARSRKLVADLKSATVVRRAWITTFISNMKALRADRDIYAAVSRATTATILGDGLGGIPDKKDYTLAAELLGYDVEQPDQWSADGPARRALVDKLNTGTDPLQLALAVSIARHERIVGDTSIKWVPTHKDAAAYLDQLRSWGYTLADVELDIVQNGTA